MEFVFVHLHSAAFAPIEKAPALCAFFKVPVREKIRFNPPRLFADSSTAASLKATGEAAAGFSVGACARIIPTASSGTTAMKSRFIRMGPQPRVNSFEDPWNCQSPTICRHPKWAHYAGAFAIAPIEQFSLEELDRLIAIDVRGVFVATQEAVRLMREGGRIIHFGSTNRDRVTFAGGSVYALTKGADISWWTLDN